MADDILIGDTPKAKKRRRRLKGVETAGRLWKHSTLADIDGLVSREFVANAFCFTLVRNPWDRMVSYYHWLRDQSFDHPAVHLACSETFEGFAGHSQTLNSFQHAGYESYITDVDGHKRASLFIRLEDFEEDAGPLWDHLGFKLILPHVNVSRRTKDFRSYYSDSLAEAVGKACASDIALFDYRF